MMNPTRITVIAGDGIGPSIIQSATEILDHAGCNFTYDYADAVLQHKKKRANFYLKRPLTLLKKINTHSKVL